MSQRGLTQVSQLIVRNWQFFKANNILVLAPPADNLYATIEMLGFTGEIFGLTVDYGDYTTINKEWISKVNEQVLFFDVFFRGVKACSSFDGIIVFLQKSVSLTEYFLDMAAVWLKKDGRLWFVGENGEGIRSWHKRLQTRFDSVEKLDAARHCQLIEATESIVVKEETFSLDKYIKKSEVSEGFNEVKINTLPGVFCYGFVDKGTLVLLNTLKKSKYGHVLDFGCGSGLISACISKHDSEAKFTLVDCNALALESAKMTMSESGVSHFNLVVSDGLREVEGKYDFIISNPPFHKGLKTDYGVVEAFIKEARLYLKVSGELRIVAHSFLKYKALILSAFGNCECIISKSGFTVYSARVERGRRRVKA